MESFNLVIESLIVDRFDELGDDAESGISFNLVIESLIVDRADTQPAPPLLNRFQSRYRESYR